MIVHFILNNQPVSRDLPPDRRLIDVLREDFLLTGAKESCGEGECGACTILLDGRAVHACLVLAGQLEGHEVLTIEGLAQNDELDIIQNAFVEHVAIQCGFCTPGMIMSSKALLDENPAPTSLEVQEALGGNICRCTGYVKIEEAVMAAAERMRKGEEAR